MPSNNITQYYIKICYVSSEVGFLRDSSTLFIAFTFSSGVSPSWNLVIFLAIYCTTVPRKFTSICRLDVTS